MNIFGKDSFRVVEEAARSSCTAMMTTGRPWRRHRQRSTYKETTLYKIGPSYNAHCPLGIRKARGSQSISEYRRIQRTAHLRTLTIKCSEGPVRGVIAMPSADIAKYWMVGPTRAEYDHARGAADETYQG